MEANLFAIRENWKQILSRAWSSKILMLAGFLTLVEVTVPLIWENGLVSFPPWVYPILMGCMVSAALVARILAQAEFD